MAITQILNEFLQHEQLKNYLEDGQKHIDFMAKRAVCQHRCWQNLSAPI